MRSSLAIWTAVFLALAAFTCGPSKEQIGAAVKKSIQHTLDTDPQFARCHKMTVTGVTVLYQGDNVYQGIAAVTCRGATYQVPVQVTVDGADVAWKTEPGAFMFAFR